MREQSTAVQRAREPSSLAVGGFEEISSRMSETFDAVARRAFEIFDNRGRTFGRDSKRSQKSSIPFILRSTRQREP